MSKPVLYEFGHSRSIRVHWLFRELAIDFESRKVDLKTEAGRAAFREITPLGKVPVVAFADGRTLRESVAICNYFADQHPGAGMIPAAGTWDRALHDQWILFLVTELEQFLWTGEKHRWYYDAARRVADCVELAYEEFHRHMPVLEKHLGGNSYMVGGAFTVADIMATHVLLWAGDRKLLGPYPMAAHYAARMAQRPAFPRDLQGK